MNARRFRYSPAKTIFGGLSTASILLGSFVVLAPTAEAQVRTIRLPQDMCDVLRERPLNERILNDIRQRPDFVRILEYVEQTCSDVSGLLIGPTGTIPTPTAAQGGGAGLPTGGGEPGGGEPGGGEPGGGEPGGGEPGGGEPGGGEPGGGEPGGGEPGGGSGFGGGFTN